MDTKVYPRPLFEVGLDVEEGLMRPGQAEKCGGCAKPFNVSRKRKGIIRAMLLLPSGGYHSLTWLLCRKCYQAAKRNDCEIPEHMKRAAEQVAALLTEPVEGHA